MKRRLQGYWCMLQWRFPWLIASKAERDYARKYRA